MEEGKKNAATEKQEWKPLDSMVTYIEGEMKERHSEKVGSRSLQNDVMCVWVSLVDGLETRGMMQQVKKVGSKGLRKGYRWYRMDHRLFDTYPRDSGGHLD